MRVLRDLDFTEAAALRQAVRDFSHRSEEAIRLHGLTLEKYQLLLLIRTTPREQATIGQLCAALHRGQSAVTRLARRLENQRLITRELSKSDARLRYLKLTKRGEERLTAAVESLREERSRLRNLVEELDGRPAQR